MTSEAEIRNAVRKPLKSGHTLLNRVIKMVPHGSFHLQEETMTELLLAGVATSAGPDVDIKLFAKNEEGKVSGADWEWWWGGRQQWFGMRVQAKRIKSGKPLPAGLRPGYDFSHQTKGGDRQIDLLIRSADRSGTEPVYVLFDDSATAPRPGPRCPLGHSFKTAYRASVISADVVLNTTGAKLRDSRDNCLGLAVPLACILCRDPGTAGHGGDLADLLIERVDALKMRRRRPDVGTVATGSDRADGESASVASVDGEDDPGAVRSSRERLVADDRLPTRVRRVERGEATEEDLEDLGGIVVVRDRERSRDQRSR